MGSQNGRHCDAFSTARVGERAPRSTTSRSWSMSCTFDVLVLRVIGGDLDTGVKGWTPGMGGIWGSKGGPWEWNC